MKKKLYVCLYGDFYEDYLTHLLHTLVHVKYNDIAGKAVHLFSNHQAI